MLGIALFGKIIKALSIRWYLNRDQEQIVQLFGGRGCYKDPVGAKVLVDDLPELAWGDMRRPAWLLWSRREEKDGRQGICRWVRPCRHACFHGVTKMDRQNHLEGHTVASADGSLQWEEDQLSSVYSFECFAFSKYVCELLFYLIA